MRNCDTCSGGGEVLLGVRVVTHDMAMHVEDLSLEGIKIPQYGPCPVCDGYGWVVVGDEGNADRSESDE